MLRPTSRRAEGRPCSHRGILSRRGRRRRQGQQFAQHLRRDGPTVLLGGFAPAALRRVARHADGFICAAPLSWAAPFVHTVHEEWELVGRAGRPRLVCQVNVAIGGADVVSRARGAIAAYYAFTGRPGWGEPLSDPFQAADTVSAYREFGADELVLYCYADDPRQVEDPAAIVR